MNANNQNQQSFQVKGGGGQDLQKNTNPFTSLDLPAGNKQNTRSKNLNSLGERPENSFNIGVGGEANGKLKKNIE